MTVCDYCGEELVATPYRRRGRTYCSRTCAEEDEYRSPELDEETDGDSMPEDDTGELL